jgi:hypothetical protein
LFKKCAYHDQYFPEENPWMLSTSKYFYKNFKNKTDGLHPECKKCGIVKATNWLYTNIDKKLESARKWNNTPKGRNKINIDLKRRQAEGKILEWQRKNPDKTRGYNEKRKHKKHDITKKEWLSCKQYFDFQCAYCGLTEEENKKLYKQQLNKEHAINNGANDISNCVPACKICNSEKNTSDINEWYNEQNLKFDIRKYSKITQWLNEDYLKYKRYKKNTFNK